MPLASKHVAKQLADLRAKLAALHHNVPPAYMIELIDIMTGREEDPPLDEEKGE